MQNKPLKGFVFTHWEREALQGVDVRMTRNDIIYCREDSRQTGKQAAIVTQA